MMYFYEIAALFLILTQWLQVVKSERASKSIDLHTADLSLDYQNSKMYAYGLFGNNVIINEKEKDKYGQLEWHSYGIPRLVYHKKSDLKNKNENCSLFEMHSLGFSILVELLT
jgi:hypothetical protein